MGIRSIWSAIQHDRVSRLRDIRPALIPLTRAPEGWSEYFEEVQGGPECVVDIDPCPEGAFLTTELDEVARGCARGGRGFRAPAGIPSFNQSMISARDPARAFRLLHQLARTCVGVVRPVQLHGRPATAAFWDFPGPAVGEETASVVFTADFDDGHRLQVDTVLVRRGSVVQHYSFVRSALPEELEIQCPYETFIAFVIAGDRNVAAVLAELAG